MIRQGDKVYDFVSYCPVLNCPNNIKPLYWKHYNCKGKTTINDKGEIKCKKCSKKDDVINWLFKCEHHDFKEIQSFQKISAVLSAVQQVLEIEDDEFILKMIDSVKHQFKKKKNENQKIKEKLDRFK